jgi:hypothetical protein
MISVPTMKSDSLDTSVQHCGGNFFWRAKVAQRNLRLNVFRLMLCVSRQ